MPPVFVIGAQRSGTTALGHELSRIFATHNKTFTVNGRLPYLLHRWLNRSDLRHRHFRADDVFHTLCRHPVAGIGSDRWVQAAGIALSNAAARTANGLSARQLHDEHRRILSDAYRGEHWGDKYNEYILITDYLADVWPDARFIAIHRHPLDVAASCVRWTKVWVPDNMKTCVTKWRQWVNTWMRIRRRLRKSQYVDLLYENVDARTIKALSTWCGCPITNSETHFRPVDRQRQGILDVSAARLWQQLRDDHATRMETDQWGL
jgi:hypothetical protein